MIFSVSPAVPGRDPFNEVNASAAGPGLAGRATAEIGREAVPFCPEAGRLPPAAAGLPLGSTAAAVPGTDPASS